MWEKQVIKNSEIAHRNVNFSVMLTLDYSILQRSTVFTPIGWHFTSLLICIKCSIARHTHIDHSCGLSLTSARFWSLEITEWVNASSYRECWEKTTFIQHMLEGSLFRAERETERGSRDPHTHTSQVWWSLICSLNDRKRNCCPPPITQTHTHAHQAKSMWKPFSLCPSLQTRLLPITLFTLQYDGRCSGSSLIGR